MLNNLKKYNIILASKSPRRRELLQGLDIDFTVQAKHADEVYPHNLPVEKVAEYLAKLKAAPFIDHIGDNDLVITADTIVCIDGHILCKPSGYDEAFQMLGKLSGRSHQVITGVNLLSKQKNVPFTAVTTVFFKELTKEETNYYLTRYQPFDKAGAYGIQEWIGYIAVERIDGSYFNVMGLPVQRLYEELQKF